MIVDATLFEQIILPQVERPAQYVAGEHHMIEKVWQDAPVRICFAFPDTYEIGMSHLGMRLIYETINRHSPYLCERSFMPLDDMAAQLKQYGLPLFSWESRHALADFDLVGFTLQYELSYTNILAMLDLAGIPLLAAARNEDMLIVIAGGPCAYNPEPLADFVDLFVIGEGEEVTLELLDLMASLKKEGKSKAAFLSQAAQIPGVYVPAFYQATYKPDGRFAALIPQNTAPERIKKRILADLDRAPFPDKPLLPSVKPVHDRIMLELMRGCTHGCRFCQAGMIYRPLREKSAAILEAQAARQVESSGYDEIALLSLSSTDYSDIMPLMDNLLAAHSSCGVGLSLPSLRVDAMSVGLAVRSQEVRKSGITFAPEAGSQHLRDIINKGVTEEDILSAVAAAFSQGYNSVKLYFMIGLPYEDQADILAIAELCRKVLILAKKHKPAEVKKPIKITLGVASFVPKPHTPFQWLGQDEAALLREKQQLLREAIRPLRQVSLHVHDADTSMLEAAFARGDRRLGFVLMTAYQKGCHLDGWSEHFHFDSWREAFNENGIDPRDYAERVFALGEPLPWAHIDCGVDTDWLWKENLRAARAELTPDCREGTCQGCGICGGDWRCVYATKRPRELTPKVKTSRFEETPHKYRCKLSVSGPMIWLSHLDLLGAMEKSLRRSGLPVAYSYGYNPHMQISWGPAHPVGLASDSEYLDLVFKQIPDGDWQARLQEALPRGLCLNSVAEITMDTKALMAAINYLKYELVFDLPNEEALDRRIEALSASPACLINRYSKKGDKTVDIRPALSQIRREGHSVFYEVHLDRGAAPKPAEIATLLLPGIPAQAFRRGMFIMTQGVLLEP